MCLDSVRANGNLEIDPTTNEARTIVHRKHIEVKKWFEIVLKYRRVELETYRSEKKLFKEKKASFGISRERN